MPALATVSRLMNWWRELLVSCTLLALGLLVVTIFAPLTVKADEQALEEWLFHKTSDGMHPNGHEQQMVWLMNRARRDPTEEVRFLANSTHPDVAFGRRYFRVDTERMAAEFEVIEPAAPAAFDVRLFEAARKHSMILAATESQHHDGQFELIRDEGFSHAVARLSSFSHAEDGVHCHAALNIDWGRGPGGMQSGRGHRVAIMASEGDLTNVGLALVPSSKGNVGPLVFTGNYAMAADWKADHYNLFVLGTVWEDENGNAIYDPGEGIGGVEIRPDRGRYFAVTGDAGGFAIPMEEAGEIEVRFSGPLEGIIPFTLGGRSVSLDVNLSGGGSFSLDGEPVAMITPPTVPGTDLSIPQPELLLRLLGGERLQLSWQTALGLTWIVQESDDLVEWRDLEVEIRGAETGHYSGTVVIGDRIDSLFYRLSTEPGVAWE